MEKLEEIQFQVGREVLRLIDAKDEASWDIAGKIISLVLSAVRDGLPLPDEVGRIPADMLGGGKGEVVHVREGDTIIILRQGGTGKEEEG